jgi:hypothetical protein
MRASRRPVIRLLDHDPELAERLPPERREEARRLLLAEIIELPRAVAASAGEAPPGNSPHGILLFGGLVSHSITLAGTTTVQLLGAGDLIEPRTNETRAGLVPVDVAWSVLEPVRAAVIDDALLRRAQRWPELLAALFERVTAQSSRQATRCAISQLPRVEDRVLTLLWFLAERWGRIGDDGVVLSLRLTHAVIGQMLGAKRPTVSLALKQLERDGAVHRRADRSWLLRRPADATAPRLRAADGGVRLLTSAAPADADAPPARIDGRQLERRVAQLRVTHRRTIERVRAVLLDAERTRERSVALRLRAPRR